MKVLLLVLAILILLIVLAALLPKDSPDERIASTLVAKDNEYPAGTHLVIGISGHPYMYMLRDEKTIRAMANAESAEELMRIVSRSLAAGGGRLISYGTKAVLALPAKPSAQWIVVRLTDGTYVGETGFLLGTCPRGSPEPCEPQFRYGD